MIYKTMKIKKYAEFNKLNESGRDWDDNGMSKAKRPKSINYKLLEQAYWSIGIFINIHTNLHYCFIIEKLTKRMCL